MKVFQACVAVNVKTGGKFFRITQKGKCTEVKISAADYFDFTGVHNQSLLSRFLRDGKNTDVTHDEIQERAHHNQAGVVRREDTTAGLGKFQGPEKHWVFELKQRDLPPPPLARPPN